MDVRCEKCQTEYELDEARLKPGGVTVKCTNCGHMFKIKKRSNTNIGVPAVVATPPSGPNDAGRVRTPSNRPASAATPSSGTPRADSMLDGSGPAASGEERQWLIRLENGEQKSCRELAVLQQWIVAGVVTRESLISRTGKTWKRLGDITELAQYFAIADEARTQRQERKTKETGKPATKPVQGTMLGIGTVPSAQGGTILPDEADELRSTGNFKARGGTTPPPPPPQAAAAPRRPATQPPPPPGSYNKKPPSPSAPPPPATEAARSFTGLPAASNRSTAAWATTGDAPETAGDAGPSGPLGGRLKAAASQEPAFAGRVRVMPSDEDAFRTGPNLAADDDDDVLPARRGSRGGAWLLVMALLVMGAAAGVVYVFVIRKDKTEEASRPPPTADAAVATVTPDAAVVTPPPETPDAAVVAPPAKTPVELAKDELGADNETRLRAALAALQGVADPGAEAMRAHLTAQIAQGLLDRAAVTADKAEAETLKKAAKQLVIDAAPAAQRAFKAAGDDALANLAMAEVLRLQGKSARELRRYADAAKAKAGAGSEWKRDVALAEGLQLARDGKLDDAKAAFTAIDSGDDKLETSGDVRARFHLALVLYAQNKPAEAKPLVEQVLAAQPEHAGAKALSTRLETTVVKTDPLPPEDNTTKPNTGSSGTGGGNTGGGGGEPLPTGGGYDALLARANKLAESSCTKATELYQKALEQKPNGVEALTGMGYCHIDAKQFSSAFSKFRAALAISSRYEPALWGVAEAYSQQGRKEQALEAVKAYLEVYPGATKALKALDRLGGGASTGTTPGSGAGSAEKPPEKPPENPPEKPPENPTPLPDPNGQPQKQPEKAPENEAGSGSG